MTKHILTIATLFLSLHTFAEELQVEVLCQSKNSERHLTLGLVPTEDQEKYTLLKHKVEPPPSADANVDSKVSTDFSVPMKCEIANHSAVCNYLMYRLSIKKNPTNDLFSVNQSLIVPEMPELENHPAFTFGDDFTCQFSE
jgi:hypothetical protein